MHAFDKMIRTPDGTPLPVPRYPDKSIIKGSALVTRDEDILRLPLEAMKKYNIVLAVVSWELKEVYKWKDASPQRFLAGQIILDPITVDITALRKEFTEGKLDIMGEIATLFNISYSAFKLKQKPNKIGYILCCEMDACPPGKSTICRKNRSSCNYFCF